MGQVFALIKVCAKTLSKRVWSSPSRVRIPVVVAAAAALVGAAGMAPADAVSTGARAAAIAAVSVPIAGSERATGSSAPCFKASYPDCSSTDPAVSWGASSNGDTTGCEFQVTVAWGDGTTNAYTFPGGSDGTQLGTFTHTYSQAGTYTIQATGQTTEGSCSSFDATLQFTLLSAAAPPSGHTFTVDGSHPVPPNPSQDTHATDPGSVCKTGHAVEARVVGAAAESYMKVNGAPDGALLLARFLANTGATDSATYLFPNGSKASKELAVNINFGFLKNAVLREVKSQLEQRATTVDLNSLLKSRTPPILDNPYDLYLAFRGTQGMTVSGSGTVNSDGSYSGTLTFTILDSYGFTPADTLNLPYRSGEFMRYLQVNCGDSAHFGTHWYPDGVVLTDSFNGHL
jgi:hypothetical protein